MEVVLKEKPQASRPSRSRKPKANRKSTPQQKKGSNKRSKTRSRVKRPVQSLSSGVAPTKALSRVVDGAMYGVRGQPQVKDFLAAIVCPSAAKETVRIASAWSSDPTHTILWNDTFTLPFATAAPASSFSYMPQAESFMVLCPGVVQSLVYYDPNIAGATSVYSAYFYNGRGSPLATWDLSDGNGEPVSPMIVTLSYSSGPMWDGPVGPVFTSKMKPFGGYVFLQELDYVVFSLSSALVATMPWNMHFTANGDSVNDFTFSAAAMTTTFTFNAVTDGYYSFDVAPGTAETASLSMLVYKPGGSGRFCFRPANPAVFQTVASLGKVRLIGHSLLAHNTSPAQYAAGVIVQKQLEVGSHWLDVLGTGQNVGAGNFSNKSVYATVSGLANVDRDRDAKRGSYVWAKPCTVEWQDWADEFDSDYGQVSYHVPIKPQQGAFVVWACNIPTVSGTYAGAANGQNIRVDVDSYIEATTDDQSRRTAVAVGDPLQFERAQIRLRFVPQYLENPTHMRDLMRSVLGGAKRTAKFVADYGPQAAQLAKLFASIL